MEKCEECKKRGELTRDHIIPQYFFRTAKEFNVELPYEMNDEKNIRMICGKCNVRKGARIETKEGRLFIRKLRERFDEMESQGIYISSKHRMAYKRFVPLDYEDSTTP